jgi:hypothetical protein
MFASTIGKPSKIQRTVVQFLLRISPFRARGLKKDAIANGKAHVRGPQVSFSGTAVTPRYQSRSTVSPVSAKPFYTPAPTRRQWETGASIRLPIYTEKEARTCVARAKSLGQLLKRCRIAPLSDISTARYFQMKAGYIGAALAAVALSGAMVGTANAAGCMKGAVVGGVAGHYAGHHAVIGAVGGCLVGRHMAKKHAEEQAEQRQQARMQ